MPSVDKQSYIKLVHAIQSLTTEDELCAFLDDICTIKELQDMSGRLEAAILLDQGLSYQKIYDQTGVSTATISRVSKCLNYGSGGYRMVLERMKEE